jgi:hypothetical protein
MSLDVYSHVMPAVARGQNMARTIATRADTECQDAGNNGFLHGRADSE